MYTISHFTYYPVIKFTLKMNCINVTNAIDV